MMQLSSQKHGLEADLRSERAKLSRAEEEKAAERARLDAELSKARQAEMDAARELSEALKRARDATAAKDVIQLQADDRWVFIPSKLVDWSSLLPTRHDKALSVQEQDDKQGLYKAYFVNTYFDAFCPPPMLTLGHGFDLLALCALPR